MVIDEIQRRPQLFPLLRVLADRKPLPARFLILGSASPDLLRQSSETLAGRLETVHLEGLRWETWALAPKAGTGCAAGSPWHTQPAARPIRRLADDNSSRHSWNGIFPNWARGSGPRLPAFLEHARPLHAQTWNDAELARACRQRIDGPPYLDLLTGVFMLRQLPPWFENSANAR